MDIKHKITEAQGLTPTEQQLGIAAFAIGEDIRGLSIKEFAARTNHDNAEAQVRTALASGPDHVAIVISYSGLAPNFKEILPILSSRHVPVIVIGTPYCAHIHPGFAAYLTVSDHESMTHRITQFASHIAVQYVLDSLYSSYFAKDYARCSEFLERSFPYTRLPGLK